MYKLQYDQEDCAENLKTVATWTTYTAVFSTPLKLSAGEEAESFLKKGEVQLSLSNFAGGYLNLCKDETASRVTKSVATDRFGGGVICAANTVASGH